MKFSIFQATRQGGRSYNQDRLAYAYSRDALLMVVADGMGGHFHGELAAQIAVQMLSDSFRSQAKPTVPRPAEFLREGFLNTHRAINDYAKSHRLAESPRTTCVACLVQDGSAYWAHSGDSRLYYFRAGRPLYRTRDHSLVQQLFESGRINAAQMATHPERNKIYSCLGGSNFPEVELSHEIAMRDNDVLLLCSDGLWSQLDLSEISAILENFPLDSAVPQLMNHAELRGGEKGDNLSAVALRWGDESRFFAERAMSAAAPRGPSSYSSLEKFRSEAGEEPEIEQAIDEIESIIKKYSK